MKCIASGVVIVIALLAGPVEAAETWTSCVPVQVATYQARIHVRCAAAVGGISFFAAATQDAAYAARLLNILTAAQLGGRTLQILFDPADLSGAAIGCATTDCRLIRAAGFGQ